MRSALAISASMRTVMASSSASFASTAPSRDSTELSVLLTVPRVPSTVLSQDRYAAFLGQLDVARQEYAGGLLDQALALPIPVLV